MLHPVKQKTFLGREHSSHHSKYLFVIIYPSLVILLHLFCCFLNPHWHSYPSLLPYFGIPYIFLLTLNVVMKNLVNILIFQKQFKHIDPFPPMSAKSLALVDFTLSNARRFYSSMGNTLGVQG